MLYRLFPDAKVFEYVAEDFVGGDFAGDFAEVVEAFADVLGDEFTTETGVKAGDNTLNSRESMGKGFVVTDVTDNDISGI